jgi:hypothetical protein
MLPNEERLKLEVLLRPIRSTNEIIQSELFSFNEAALENLSNDNGGKKEFLSKPLQTGAVL